jgi:hypothetical protein
MATDRSEEDFHFKLIREHPTLETWGHVAVNEEDALQYFTKKLGVRLELCTSPSSYRLEKYCIEPNGDVRHENVLRIRYVKPR